MPLNALKVKTAGAGRYADGGGLYLLVKPSGSRSWVLRWQRDGKRFDRGLGPFPAVSLKEARAKAQDAQRRLHAGEPPFPMRPKALTFRDAAEALIAKRDQQWAQSLRDHVYPVLGDRDVAAIASDDILAVLEPIWSTKTVTASRVRQRIEAVLDYATVQEARSGDNPARWRGRLEYALDKPASVHRVRHHAALDWREAPALMTRIDTREPAARALAFLMLTAARSGEVRGARWSEVDGAVWTIPAARMKAHREHRIPLAPAALALLGPPGEPGDIVFQRQPGRMLTDRALLDTLTRIRPVTVHGLRSTFRDWAGETTAHPREVIEHALAHQLRDKAEAAYARGDLFTKRRVLMEDWAAFLVPANVSRR